MVVTPRGSVGVRSLFLETRIRARLSSPEDVTGWITLGVERGPDATTPFAERAANWQKFHDRMLAKYPGV